MASNLLYGQNSRYYNVDTSYDIPQSNMLCNTYSYNTVTVTSTEAGRLDLVSLRVYNTPVHWWIIARFNGIINPDSVIEGSVLRVPIL